MFLLCRCGGLRGGIVALHDFHPLLPVSGTGTGFDSLPSRERGIMVVGLDLFTLTFDSSPIKGDGDIGGCFGLLLPHTSAALWIPAYAGMTVLDTRNNGGG